MASNRYFVTNTVVADCQEPADCLMIVSRGLVEVCLPAKEGGRVLRVLKRGFEESQNIEDCDKTHKVFFFCRQLICCDSAQL